MKILVTSDWHGDATTAGVPREEDVAIAVRDVIEGAVREKADLVLFLGDLCDPDSARTHRAAALGVLAAAELWQRHKIPSRWLVGNHDVVEDGAGTHTLAGIAALEHAHRGAETMTPIRVFDRPAFDVIPEKGRAGVLLVALPFTPRSPGYDPAASLATIARHMPRHDRVIIAGHLCLEGIEPGSETLDMPRGRDVFFPIEAAKVLFPSAICVNGHYHRRQVYKGVVVPGALERLTFGEESHAPGYVILDV